MLLRVRSVLSVALPIIWPRIIVQFVGWLAEFTRSRRQFYGVKPWWAFIGWLLFENEVLALVDLSFVYQVFHLAPPWWSGFRISIADYLLYSCLWAPVEETVLFQVLPIEFFRFLGFPVGGQLVLSWFTFASLHYAGGGLGHGLGPGLVGGFYLASAYLHFRPYSWWGAVTATVGIHALHNFLCLVIW